jgi:hypothetical protein
MLMILLEFPYSGVTFISLFIFPCAHYGQEKIAFKMCTFSVANQRNCMLLLLASCLKVSHHSDKLKSSICKINYTGQVCARGITTRHIDCFLPRAGLILNVKKNELFKIKVMSLAIKVSETPISKIIKV